MGQLQILVLFVVTGTVRGMTSGLGFRVPFFENGFRDRNSGFLVRSVQWDQG